MAYGMDYRRRVIAFVQEGGSKLEAARLFKVHPETVYEWLKRGMDLSPRPAKTRQRKIDKEALRRHVREYPDALLRERAKVFKVTPEAVCYLMKTMKLVKKTA
jgi:putative transposase